MVDKLVGTSLESRETALEGCRSGNRTFSAEQGMFEVGRVANGPSIASWRWLTSCQSMEPTADFWRLLVRSGNIDERPKHAGPYLSRLNSGSSLYMVSECH